LPHVVQYFTGGNNVSKAKGTASARVRELEAKIAVLEQLVAALSLQEKLNGLAARVALLEAEASNNKKAA
jgi:hypothetical protein